MTNNTQIIFNGEIFDYFTHFPIKNSDYTCILASCKKTPDEIKHFFIIKHSELTDLVLSPFSGNTVDLSNKAELLTEQNFIKRFKEIKE